MSRLVLLIGFLVTLVAGALIYFSSPNGYAWDFHQFYAAGKLPAGEMHDEVAQIAMQERLWREHRPWVESFNFSPYAKPSYYRVVWGPLARLPFWTAYAIWAGLNLAAFVVGLWLLTRRYGPEPSVLLLAPLFAPLTLTLLWGQDTCVLFLLIVLSLELGLRGRPGWSGAVLALGLFKWNSILLLPAAMLFQKRGRWLCGFVPVALAEVGISVWMMGAEGLADARALAASPALRYWSDSMPCLRGLLLWVGAPSGPAFAGAALAAVAFLWAIRRLNFEQTYAMGTTAGVFLTVHAMGYDLLFPLVAVMILRERMTTGLRAAVVTLWLSPLWYFADRAVADTWTPGWVLLAMTIAVTTALAGRSSARVEAWAADAQLGR